MTGSRLQLGEPIGFWEGWGIALVVAALALLSLMRLRESRKADIVPVQE
jgi:hypothetical protein